MDDGRRGWCGGKSSVLRRVNLLVSRPSGGGTCGPVSNIRMMMMLPLPMIPMILWVHTTNKQTPQDSCGGAREWCPGSQFSGSGSILRYRGRHPPPPNQSTRFFNFWFNYDQLCRPDNRWNIGVSLLGRSQKCYGNLVRVLTFLMTWTH